MIVIVGEAPSRSSDPLRPFCGWSGNWLAKHAGLSGYEELADRARLVNLLKRWPGPGHSGEKGSRFPMVGGRRAAKRLAKEFSWRDRVLLAGRRVAAAFDLIAGLSDTRYFEWRHVPMVREYRDGGYCIWHFQMAVIPHPSGCNHWWNDARHRRRARRFLEEQFA